VWSKTTYFDTKIENGWPLRVKKAIKLDFTARMPHTTGAWPVEVGYPPLTLGEKVCCPLRQVAGQWRCPVGQVGLYMNIVHIYAQCKVRYHYNANRRPGTHRSFQTKFVNRQLQSN